MNNRDSAVALSYAEAVYQRAEQPLPPEGFKPNWADQPSRYKIYLGSERLPLPFAPPGRLAATGEVLQQLSRWHLPMRALPTSDLLGCLLLAHSPLRLRVEINGNHDERARARYSEALLGRGTPSGGGLYPTEIYWICGRRAPLLPGIYHYDAAHHALETLYHGDLTAQLQGALAGYPAALAANQFLLISLNFWKNSFKYSSFCYHVVTMDLGALLCSLRLLFLACGSELEALFWFHDERLNQLLGLETLAESVFAVVPLVTAPALPHLGNWLSQPLILSSEARADQSLPVLAPRSFQRSYRVLRFPLVEEVHQATLIQDEPRPTATEVLQAAAGESVASGPPLILPAPETGLRQSSCDLAALLRDRQSGFGRFTASKPLAIQELSTLLYYSSATRSYPADIKAGEARLALTRLMVFVQRVEGIEPGIYAYDADRHCLWGIEAGDFSRFLQRHYFLQNYSFERAGAVVAIVGRTSAVLTTFGNRGYRFLNAETGMVAQGLYITAAALSIGCGAVLGFNNRAINRVLGLVGTEERSLLLVLLGHVDPQQGYLDLPLLSW